MAAGAPPAAAQLAPEQLVAWGPAIAAVTRVWPSIAFAVRVLRAAAWALPSVWVQAATPGPVRAREATSGAAVEVLKSAAVRMVKPSAAAVETVESPESALQPQSGQKSGRHLPVARRQAPDSARARCVAVSDQIG
jgi:hypothetical protein